MRNASFPTLRRKIIALCLALALCLMGVPASALASVSSASNDAAPVSSSNGSIALYDASDEGEGEESEVDYPYKSGYTQIDAIYAFDAATYPYGNFTTCGGYDYDSGPWTGDTPTITEKGEQLQFEARATFVSGNTEDPNASVVVDDNQTVDGTTISWSVSDASVATIDFQSGLFTPVSNGTVYVTATLYAAKAYDGQALAVTFPVVIDINLSAYITNLKIIAPDGETVISNSETASFNLYTYLADKTGITDFDELAASVAPQFYVEVEVYDPTTDAFSTYKVHSGTELNDACGISDLSWGQAADSSDYSIDAASGMLRMLHETGVNQSIRVYTRATKTGSLLEDRASLLMSSKQGDISEDESGYVPSDTLTVMAYYRSTEDHIDINDPDNEYWLRLDEHDGATSVTYTQSDLQAISSRDQAYTMVGENRSCQAIASGVNLTLLLQDALGPDISISDIEGFYFKTFDQGYLPGQFFVSASALFSNRYFYPYYFQGGDKTGATQVYPILAWSSKLYWSDKYPDVNVSDPSNWNREDMSGASRYRLIFGAQPGDGFSTRNSVYCIQTMYVVLKGGPSISDGDGDDDDPSKPSNPGQGGNTETDNPGTGEGGNNTGEGGNTGPQVPQGGITEPDSGDPSDQEKQEGQSEEQANAKKSDGVEEGDQASTTQVTRRQTIYQMMTTKDQAVTLAVQNTLGWTLIPLSSIAFAAGIAYAILWFRRQTAPVSTTGFSLDNAHQSEGKE